MTASLTDALILFSSVEWAEVPYPIGTTLGAFCGAVVNFYINRHWTFRADRARWEKQAIRYAAVSSGSLLLNVGLVVLFTESLGLKYGWSKIAASLLVGFCFNFPLHKKFVFKN